MAGDAPNPSHEDFAASPKPKNVDNVTGIGLHTSLEEII